MQQKTLYLDLNLTRPHFKPLLSPYSRSRASTDMIAGDFQTTHQNFQRPNFSPSLKQRVVVREASDVGSGLKPSIISVGQHNQLSQPKISHRTA